MFGAPSVERGSHCAAATEHYNRNQDHAGLKRLVLPYAYGNEIKVFPDSTLKAMLQSESMNENGFRQTSQKVYTDNLDW